MKRRQSREYALQLLFQLDFTGKKPDRAYLDEFWKEHKEEDKGKSFAEEILQGAIEHLEDIDSAIRKAAENWVIERIAAVDRNILRCAIYELLFRSDIPSTVTINEALEIAKKYSSIEAASFINGILDKIAKGIKGKRAR